MHKGEEALEDTEERQSRKSHFSFVVLQSLLLVPHGVGIHILQAQPNPCAYPARVAETTRDGFRLDLQWLWVAIDKSDSREKKSYVSL